MLGTYHRIKTVWHFDGIPEKKYQKSWFWKKTAGNKKAGKISQEAKI